MRKEYRRAARALFTAALRDALPALEPVKVDTPLIWGGETVFRWVPCDAFHGYAILVPSPTGHQAFTLEVGWSTRGRFPEAGSRPTLMLGPDEPEPLDVDEGIVRLGGLAGEAADLWWRLPDPAVERPGSVAALGESVEPLAREQAEERVRPRVAEAIVALLEHGVPFLERVAERACRSVVSPRRT